MREEYEGELKESEGSLHEVKRKLKDARSSIQEYEEAVSKLRTQITQLECQLTTSKQVIKIKILRKLGDYFHAKIEEKLNLLFVSMSAFLYQLWTAWLKIIEMAQV